MVAQCVDRALHSAAVGAKQYVVMDGFASRPAVDHKHHMMSRKGYQVVAIVGTRIGLQSIVC